MAKAMSEEGESSVTASLLDMIRFYPVVTAFCVGSLSWSLIAALLHRILPRSVGTRLGQRVMSAGFRSGLWLMRATRLARFDLNALDALRDAGPMVIICNHLSLLDALLVVSRLPRAVCIAKAGLWDNPALGGSVRLAGYIRNDAPLAMIRDGARALRQGTQLVIFPEGTRSEGGRLGRFKGGFVLMARAAGAPIQTVFLDSNTPYLRRGWRLSRMPAFPLRYRARCGRCFTPGTKVAEGVAMLQNYFAEELAKERAG